MESNKIIKVITLDGKEFKFDSNNVKNLADLKIMVLKQDFQLPDFSFVYKGRKLSDKYYLKPLKDFLDEDCYVIHTVGADIKGGCGQIIIISYQNKTNNSSYVNNQYFLFFKCETKKF